MVDAPPPDVPPDIAATWTIDPSSGKGAPATAAEWTSLIAVRNLNVDPPQGLWPMQDLASGTGLIDVTGNVDLGVRNSPLFRQPVLGWTRLAVGMPDFSNREFYNNTDASLPDVATTSMTVLLVFQILDIPNPPGIRSILFGGSGIQGRRADVELDGNLRLRIGINGTYASGTVNYGSAVIPMLLKLDVTNMQQKILTSQELVQLPYVPLQGSRGLVLGGANNPSPDLRCLYMAAWYGTSAEISDADLRAMLSALGW